MFQCTLQVFAGSPSGIPVYFGSTSGIPVPFQCTLDQPVYICSGKGIHCDLVIQNGDINLVYPLFRHWLPAYRHQTINWANVDLSSVACRSVHLKATSLENADQVNHYNDNGSRDDVRSVPNTKEFHHIKQCHVNVIVFASDNIGNWWTLTCTATAIESGASLCSKWKTMNRFKELKQTKFKLRIKKSKSELKHALHTNRTYRGNI